MRVDAHIERHTRPEVFCLQVCLAAEKCGHLDFDIRSDMWWRSQGFHCGDTPAGGVSFADIFWKVWLLAPSAARLPHSALYEAAYERLGYTRSATE